MRRLLFILLIALLPLRGWATASLATEMVADQVASLQMDAGQEQAHTPAAARHASQQLGHAPAEQAAHEPTHRTAFEGGHQVAAAAHDCHEAADAAHPSHGDCGNCQACQACHTVGLTADTVRLVALPLPGAPLPQDARSFASATAALAQKPPIS